MTFKGQNYAMKEIIQPNNPAAAKAEMVRALGVLESEPRTKRLPNHLNEEEEAFVPT